MAGDACYEPIKHLMRDLVVGMTSCESDMTSHLVYMLLWMPRCQSVLTPPTG